MVYTTWIDRCRRVLLSMPIVVKMTGIALAMATVLATGLSLQIYHGWRADELEELKETGRIMARRVAGRIEALWRANNSAGLPQALQQMSQAMTNVNAIQVLDRQGQLLAEIGPKNPKARVSQVTVRGPARFKGTVCVSIDHTHIDAELAWLTRRLLLTIAVIAGIGMAGAWWAAHIFTRPIRELVQKTRAVKAGDYTARAQVQYADEAGELAGAFNEMVAEIQQRETIERQLLRNLITAEDEERKRVARALHDHTGQVLTSLIAGLATLKSGTLKPEQLNDLLHLAAETLSEVHDLSRTLRPMALDELGLNTALKKLCQTCSERFGLKVDCSVIGFDENPRLPHDLEVALYRISQEAITNAVRHSKCKSLELMIHRRAESVLMVIEDDGEGFDARDWRTQCLRGDHYGLLGMEQRATLLGGTFCVESRSGGGTSLFVELPSILRYDDGRPPPDDRKPVTDECALPGKA